MRSSITNFVLLSSLCFCIGGLVFAGSTTPPAGPVSPTMKTLDEVEPRIAINAVNTPGDADSVFRIASPGSYYLTGNVTGVVGDRGIEIASDHVSIDLMGYTLQGVAGSLTGIATDGAARNNLTIRNGVVAGWGGDGIDLIEGGFGESALIEGVHASANGSYGIRTGYSAVVRDCTAESNASIGIVADAYSTIERCSARLNGNTGISAQTSCTVRGCSASVNSIAGFFVGTGSVVSECVSYNNGSDGFATGTGVTITGCSAYINGSDGFLMGSGATITGCSAYDNDQDGIDVSSSSTVVNCSSYANTVDGIEAFSDCVILGNTVDNNSGAGIQVGFSDCRIEGNNVTDSPIGIDVNGSGNLIIKNSAAGNSTHYDIVANNRYGPIINITVLGTPAVVGSSAASTVTTTDPWANFSY